MENLKKENVCLDVSTPEKHKEVIELLQKYNEEIYKSSLIYLKKYYFIKFCSNKEWSRDSIKCGTLINPQQLEQILKKERGIEMPESIDQLTENFKSKAKELGFKVDIVFEEIDPRIGTFGKFWGDSKGYIHYGTLTSINIGDIEPFEHHNEVYFANFQPLTQSEIAELTKNNPK